MRFKPSETAGGVTVELGPDEAQFPPIPLPEVHLKKILVPIDFSECSSKAVAYAAALAKQFHASVHLLHVQTPPTPIPALIDFPVAAEGSKEVQEKLQRVARSVDPAITREITVLVGTPEDEIVSAIDDNNIDLVIFGTHGRTGLQHWLQGSVTERVLRRATCPVLIVRQEEHDFVG